MPRLPIDYSKTVIYKIVANDLSITECYVGSTTDFTRRKQWHKSACSNEKGKSYDLKVYKTIRDNGGWAEWCMVEIEKYPCNDANEATSRERYWFGILNSNLNTIYPHRTRAQYRADNKDDIRQKAFDYRHTNKDSINERRFQLLICECGTSSSLHNISRHLKSAIHKKNMDAEKNLDIECCPCRGTNRDQMSPCDKFCSTSERQSGLVCS